MKNSRTDGLTVWFFLQKQIVAFLIVLLFCSIPSAAAERESQKLGTLSDHSGASETSSAWAEALGIDRSEMEEISNTCREAGFTSAEIQRMFNLMVKAKLAGLPHLDLLNKLHEGLAKGAPPEAVGVVLQRRAQALRRAKSIVDTLLVEGWSALDYTIALQQVGDVLEGGVSASEVLKSVREDEILWEDLPDVRHAFAKASPNK